MDKLEELTGIIVPVTLFICLLAGVALVLAFRRVQESERHETLRRMVEKGVEIPMALLAPTQKPLSDLRHGLVLVGGASGTLALLLTVSDLREYWAAALIPLLMGAGRLAAWWIAERSRLMAR
jgi:hypothetical protein